MPDTIIKRVYTKIDPADSNISPPICDVTRIDGTNTRVKARVLDAEEIFQVILDMQRQQEMVQKTLEGAFPGTYASTLSRLRTSLSSHYAQKGITELADSAEMELWTSPGCRGNNELITHQPSRPYCTAILAKNIKPWYTMIAVLWQDEHIFGFRLYDWLLNTTADFSVDSVIKQVRDKTVKITNLDWLVDAMSPSGELRCTQGLYEDYTALDICGAAINTYHPLVILGFSPARLRTGLELVLVDYKGNVIYEEVSRVKTNFYSDSGLIFQPSDNPIYDLVLTTGIANAVIAVPQKNMEVADFREVYIRQQKFSELIPQAAINAVNALGLEPFQQGTTDIDGYQSVLGFICYKCRGDVYRRVDWDVLLAATNNLLVSTLMTVYDPDTNRYLQVPYSGMHICRDLHMSRTDATCLVTFKTATALNYRDTYYPELKNPYPKRVFDNCGRDVLLSDYKLADFITAIQDLGYNNSVAVEVALMNYINQTVPYGTTELYDDQGVVQDIKLYTYSNTSGMLFNPGAVFTLTPVNEKSLQVELSDDQKTSRYGYEVIHGSPIPFTLNTALTADVFRLLSNILDIEARGTLAGNTECLEIDEDQGCNITLPDSNILSVNEVGYVRKVKATSEAFTYMVSGSNFALAISGLRDLKNALVRLVLNPTTTVCNLKIHCDTYYTDISIHLLNIISDSVEALYTTSTEYKWDSDELTLPDSLMILGRAAFIGCKFKKVTLPANIRRIGTNCFALCENLETLELPEGLEIIGSQAFTACVSLKRIIIPASVKIIHSKAFSDCSSLVDVTILGNPLIASDAFLNTPSQTESRILATHDTFSGTANDKATKDRLAEKQPLFR